MVQIRRSAITPKKASPLRLVAQTLLIAFIVLQVFHLTRKALFPPSGNRDAKSTTDDVVTMVEKPLEDMIVELEHKVEGALYPHDTTHVDADQQNVNADDQKELVAQKDDDDDDEEKEKQADDDEKQVNAQKSDKDDETQADDDVTEPASAFAEAEIGKDHAMILAKQGTGPTPLAYVFDLVQERQQEAFREIHAAELPHDSAETAAQLTGHSKLTPCLENGSIKAICKDAETVLVAYNPHDDLTVTLCGQTIAAKQAVVLEDHCDEPAHVLADVALPPVTGQGMPPMQICSTPQGPAAGHAMETVPDCPVPCQYEETATDDWFVAGTPWTLHQTDANPYYTGGARMERTAFRRNQFYSTTSWKSSIPLSFYSFDDYNLRNRPMQDFQQLQAAATYLVDEDCNSGNLRRNKWFEATQLALTVNAYASCNHNTDLQPGETIDTVAGRVKLMQKNRIVLVLDNGNEKDHLTPIVFESLLAGVVPAILGASNAARRLPRNAAIYAEDYNSWDTFAAYVAQVANDEALWQSFHAWRTDESELAAFEARFAFTKTSPKCRTCKWAYSKKYGLGWDHGRQEIREPAVGRALCVEKSSPGLVQTPFREEWVRREGIPPLETEAQTTEPECTAGPETATLDVDGYKVVRSVVQHDGVVDMTIESIEEGPVSDDVYLRIHVNVRNTEGAYFPHTHTLVEAQHTALVSSASVQDDVSKVTVLANWETTIQSPAEGVVEIRIKEATDVVDRVRKIRVISEEMSELHDKMTEYYPSSFGRIMIKDFCDPLEFFHV